MLNTRDDLGHHCNSKHALSSDNYREGNSISKSNITTEKEEPLFNRVVLHFKAKKQQQEYIFRQMSETEGKSTVNEI